MRVRFWVVLFVLTCAAACNNPAMNKENKEEATPEAIGSYGADLKFLQEHAPGAIELVSEDGSAKVLLSAAYQGRVMTSTAAASNL